jgi:hypothetical protein
MIVNAVVYLLPGYIPFFLVLIETVFRCFHTLPFQKLHNGCLVFLFSVSLLYDLDC